MEKSISLHKVAEGMLPSSISTVFSWPSDSATSPFIALAIVISGISLFAANK